MPTAVAPWSLAIHGGAGVMDLTNTAALDAAKAGLQHALRVGQAVLEAGGSALDAVDASCSALEDHSSFNAGRGAVYTLGGKIELEASIMTHDRQCGAAALLTRVKNPIKLARKVMEATPHTFLAGTAAEEFAAQQGLELVDGDPLAYFGTPARAQQRMMWLTKHATPASVAPGAAAAAAGSAAAHPRPDDIVQQLPHGTVGAVAIDSAGGLAAATSTGGRTCKYDGRIGDTPIIGAGNWASSLVAVSGTGIGEQFQRHCVAHDVHARMEYGGLTLQDAVHQVVHGGAVLKPDDGGVVAVGRDYSVAMSFNSPGMYRGGADHTGRFWVAIGPEAVDGTLQH